MNAATRAAAAAEEASGPRPEVELQSADELHRADDIQPVDEGPAIRRDVLSILDEAMSADDAWTLHLPDLADGRARVAESLFTVADGTIGTRGSLEEDGLGSDPVTVAAGVYDAAAETGQTLLQIPSWTELALHRGVAAGRRVLDLRTGALCRDVQDGGDQALRTARWACLARPGVEVLVAAGDREVLGPVQGSPLVVVERRSALGSGVVGLIETATAVEHSGPDHAAQTFIRRIATFGSGLHRVPRSEHVSAQHYDAHRAGVRKLFEEQQAAWAARWATSDIEIEGDPDMTRAIRLALFHIAGSVAAHGEAALGARGLSGTAYAGHVFWDADVFVLPVLAATHPVSARAMLEYRIRRLPQARRDAEAGGHAGARFPWESAADGRDVTPRSGMDALGQVVPILTGPLEEHITADVAWAAWQLASFTGSWRLLEGPARGLLVDTARYWASRIRRDGAGGGHLDHVIGPDEYHEDVDDNAYTNVMAAWNLRRGAEVLERTAWGAPVPEAEEWRALADSLVTGWDARRGHHLQFAGFDELEPLTAAALGRVPVAADLVLGHERVAASQIVKQADVVMLHHLLPDLMPPGSRQADLDYYLPRTAHGSSLSPSIHAAVLARCGRVQEAADMLDLASRVDLDDLTGTTAGGLHMAAMGGLWQALVFGFAGLQVTRPDEDALRLHPRLPEHWRELRLSLCWHGRTLRLRCRNDAVHVECDQPLALVVGSGQPVRVIPPGAWIPLHPGGHTDDTEVTP